MANNTDDPIELIAHIKHLYHLYRHTADADAKGLFFSPTCLQVCRPKTSFAATTREEIVQYLKDAQKGVIQDEQISANDSDSTPQQKGKGVYTIRALQRPEQDFGTQDVTAPIKLTPLELAQKCAREGWVGVRVDIWNQGGSEGGFNGRLFKVNYWYRRERIPDNERLDGDEDGYGWRQCLHDILYMDQKDGSEGAPGLEVLE